MLGLVQSNSWREKPWQICRGQAVHET